MTGAHVEYVGFTTKGPTREYTLRVRQAQTDAWDFVVVIPIEAFTSRRVRYQDAPEVCFIKLQRELVACEGLPARLLHVTDADLEDYRAAHAPKPQQRRPRPPVAV